MFRITIDSTVVIKDCPKNGLDAIDFRKGHGLTPEPSNRYRVVVALDSEPLCRQFADVTTEGADIVTSNGYGPLDRAEVPADVLAAIDRGKPETIVPVLEILREDVAERKRKEEAERAATIARNEEYSRQDAERARARQDGVDRLRRWADQHGSDLLRARIAEEFEWESLAAAEFGEHVQTQLGYTAVGIPDGYADEPTAKESKTPSLSDIQALRIVRERIAALDVPASASLEWLIYDPLRDEDGYADPFGPDPLKRTEICVEVKVPTGDRRYFYLLPSDVVQASA